MNLSKDTEIVIPASDGSSGMSRRLFFKRATIAGATSAVALSGLVGLGAASGQEVDADARDERFGPHSLKKGDHDILVAAEVAEALAVTTYSNIINTAPFFTRLESDDQGYLMAALQEEMSHYLLEQEVTDEFTPFTSFFYPPKMFADAQTTLNTLVTLEDAFIAAYLVGVRNFSTTHLRVTAARIMGIESDHRTLARVIGPGVAAQDAGPIEMITGAQGVAESVDPPNNNGYERTLCWTNINQALAALMPFVDKTAAKKAGFDTSKSYPFEPFNPVLPNPLGEFISFKGC
ncbi:ferritin-like domain-containing protein [Alloacidobacterium dinghuense]|uniref:Ferritin-like domain-containing protein n=1 Tax=Alloacidobacterium dinghuense TaxID=2763107 RepID=A0A7G8BMK3_9BACT|nr:ferritin-like domain-containing protein [Alloacidobacterium dinghuense]QNI33773.1 ferritin-like domain-containing protein [Alloacidobacterium dinghuense]